MHVSTMMILLFARILAGILIPSSANANRLDPNNAGIRKPASSIEGHPYHLPHEDHVKAAAPIDPNGRPQNSIEYPNPKKPETSAIRDDDGNEAAIVAIKSTNSRELTTGCHENHVMGYSYNLGDWVSAMVTETSTPEYTLDPNTGLWNTEITTTTKRTNYKCIAMIWCGSIGFGPGETGESLAWEKELAECSGTATPAKASVPPLWERGGCPMIYVAGTQYDAGDAVSVDDLVYQCRNEPSNLWCGMAGYEPGNSIHWNSAWEMTGSCSGILTPTGSPVFEVMSHEGGCPDVFNRGVTYEEGDKISRNELIYQCRLWPRSLQCSQAGFEPGVDNVAEHWKQAWFITGYCSGTISPTTSPSFDPVTFVGGCPDEWEVSGSNVRYRGGDMVSVTISDSPLRNVAFRCKPWPYSAHCGQYTPTEYGGDLGWTSAGGCDGSISVIASLFFAGLVRYADCPQQYMPNNDYQAGNLVSFDVTFDLIHKFIYECKPYPYTAWCSQGIYYPTGPYSDMSWNLKGYCAEDVALTNEPSAQVRIIITFDNLILPVDVAEREAVVSTAIESITKIITASLKPGQSIIEIKIISISNVAVRRDLAVLRHLPGPAQIDIEIVLVSNVGVDQVVTALTEDGVTETVREVADDNGITAFTIATISRVNVTGANVTKVVEISRHPSIHPSTQPSSVPSEVPPVTDWPSAMPSESPSTSAAPSSQPSMNPSVSDWPTSQPSSQPSTQPSTNPSLSRIPTGQPSEHPSVSDWPTSQPSEAPSLSGRPSSMPSSQPSTQPSSVPSEARSVTDWPSTMPSESPSISAAPSSQPSMNPSVSNWPTSQPSSQPSTQPSTNPSLSSIPSGQPSEHPSVSDWPTSQPSESPSLSGRPSSMPSSQPSTQPILVPSEAPSVTGQPSSMPSGSPSARATSQPSSQPSTEPSMNPSFSSQPTRRPTRRPTSRPIPAPSPKRRALSHLEVTGSDINAESIENCKEVPYYVGLYVIPGPHFSLGITLANDRFNCPSNIAFNSIDGKKTTLSVLDEYTKNLPIHPLGKAFLGDIIEAEKHAIATDEFNFDLVNNNCLHYARSIWHSLGLAGGVDLADFIIENTVSDPSFEDMAKEMYAKGGVGFLLAYKIGGKVAMKKFVADIVRDNFDALSSDSIS